MEHFPIFKECIDEFVALMVYELEQRKMGIVSVDWDTEEYLDILPTAKAGGFLDANGTAY